MVFTAPRVGAALAATPQAWRCADTGPAPIPV